MGHCVPPQERPRVGGGGEMVFFATSSFLSTCSPISASLPRSILIQLLKIYACKIGNTRILAYIYSAIYGSLSEQWGSMPKKASLQKGAIAKPYHKQHWSCRELKPHHLVAATAFRNRMFLIAMSANGRQWRKAADKLRFIQQSFRVDTAWSGEIAALWQSCISNPCRTWQALKCSAELEGFCSV